LVRAGHEQAVPMSTRRSFTTALAVALALNAMSAPVAFGGGPSGALPRPGAGEQDSERAGTTIVRVRDGDGFDWADAGIGAAAGVALSALGLGLGFLVLERRAERWTYSSPVTSSRSRRRDQPSRSDSNESRAT
jgi:hypothetical protein